MVRDYKERVCEYCKTVYKANSASQRACKGCIAKLRDLHNQVIRDVARFEKFGTYEYVGRGFSNKKGKENAGYKTGIVFFEKVLKPAVRTRRFCERCGKDLLTAHYNDICVHHRDGDRTHNHIDNMELLCTKCHIRHHHFKGEQ